MPLRVRVVEVEGDVTRELRRRVLRPRRGPDDPLPGDELEGVVHLAALDEDTTVTGACLLYDNDCDFIEDGRGAVQLMQMAIAPEHQRQGVGSRVLAEVERMLHARDVPVVWCHARTYAVPFYASAGWQVVGAEFVRYPEPDEPVPHFRMYRELLGASTSSV